MGPKKVSFVGRYFLWCPLLGESFNRGSTVYVEHQEHSPRGYGSTDPYDDVTFHQETRDQRPPAALPRDVDDTTHYVDPIGPPPLERALLEEKRKLKSGVQDKDPDIISTDYENVPPRRSHKSRGESYLVVQPPSGRGVDGGEHETEGQTSGSK